MRTKCNKRKIKGQKGVRPNWSLIFGENKTLSEEKRRREEEEKKGMETMILVWIIGLLDFCMEKSNHKPIF